MPGRPLLPLLLATLFAFALVTPAHAEDAVRLVVEAAQEDLEIEAGEVVSIQVVGEADSGARVGFGGRRVELTASAGTVDVVKRPYRYLYGAPADVERPTDIVLRARLTEAPNVRGRLTVRVIPRKPGSGPYEKLSLQTGSREVQLGTAIEVQVFGVPPKGKPRPVVDQRITLQALGHTDPAGTVAFVTQGTFRYRAPKAGGAYAEGDRVRLVAVLDRMRGVRGELELVLKGPGPGDPRPPDGMPPDRQPPTVPPKPRDPEERKVPPAPDADQGLLFPSGNLRAIAWRTRDLADKKFGDRRSLPTRGTRFVAPAPVQRLRLSVERARVARLSLEWRIGKEEGAKLHKLEPSDDGSFRVFRDRDEKLTARVDMTTPEDGTVVMATLVLTTVAGKQIREPFRLQRGRDRDRDGRVDKAPKQAPKQAPR